MCWTEAACVAILTISALRARQVDSEHKATKLKILDISNPHARAFHVSWWGFFSSFFSMFAAAPLMVYMKKPTSLNLTKSEIATGNICAVAANIVMRATTG